MWWLLFSFTSVIFAFVTIVTVGYRIADAIQDDTVAYVGVNARFEICSIIVLNDRTSIGRTASIRLCSRGGAYNVYPIAQGELFAALKHLEASMNNGTIIPSTPDEPRRDNVVELTLVKDGDDTLDRFQ